MLPRCSTDFAKKWVQVQSHNFNPKTISAKIQKNDHRKNSLIQSLESESIVTVKTSAQSGNHKAFLSPLLAQDTPVRSGHPLPKISWRWRAKRPATPWSSPRCANTGAQTVVTWETTAISHILLVRCERHQVWLAPDSAFSDLENWCCWLPNFFLLFTSKLIMNHDIGEP